MPLYEYKGFNSAGKGVSGVLDAPSRSEVFTRLKARGIHPSHLAEDSGAAIKKFRIKKDELAFTLEQLSTLLHAGLPLTQALESLSFQVESEGMKRALARTKSALQEGLSFPNALRESRAFPDLMIHLVESAEAVGALEPVLTRYAGFLRTEADFTRKLLASLTYPLIIMLACLGLLIFMLTYISPTLLEIFGTLKKTLPLTTRILMGTGIFLRVSLPYIVVLIAVAVFVFVRMVPRKTMDRLKLRVPALGNIYLQVMLTRWSQTLALLHAGGVSMVRALAASREVLENVYLQEYMLKVEEEVERGKSLSVALSAVPGMPDLLLQMTETGERSGELDKLLNSAAEFYQKDIERRLAVFLAVLEPALIIGMGVVVGFVVISILLPIFDLNRLIK